MSYGFHQPIVATQIKLDELGNGSAGNLSNRALGSVIVEIGKDRLNREKIEMLGLNLFMLLFVLLTTMLIAMRVSRRITLPVLEMNNAIRRIGEGHLDTHIAGNQVQELDALASGINDMAHLLQQDRNTLQQRIDEATQEMRRKKEEAERANFDKSRFLAAASHDLRQPMHALGLFVGELHSRLDTAEQRKIASKVEESVEAMSGLLDSLLDISKLDAGIVIPQIQRVDIDAMMKRLVQDFVPVAQRKNITLRVRCTNQHGAERPGVAGTNSAQPVEQRDPLHPAVTARYCWLAAGVAMICASRCATTASASRWKNSRMSSANSCSWRTVRAIAAKDLDWDLPSWIVCPDCCIIR